MRKDIFLVAMGLVLLLSPLVEANAPWRWSLIAQIAQSKAIAVAKVTKIDPIPYDEKGPTVWRPNCKVSMEITAILRGDPGKVVTVLANLNNRIPIQKGSPVMLFISAFGKNGFVEVFEAAQGLHPLSALVRATGDNEADKLIEKAIWAAIADSKPSGKQTRFYSYLGPKAAGHFLALAQSANEKARRFGIISLIDMENDKEIEKVLVQALKDQNREIQENAAVALVMNKYFESADAVADYITTLPIQENPDADLATFLRFLAFRFLAQADPKKYDYAGQFHQWLRQQNPSPHQIFAGTLRTLPKEFSVCIQLEINRELKCIVKKARSIQQDELFRFMRSLEKLNLPSVRRIPFFCEIVIGYDNEKESVKVTVR